MRKLAGYLVFVFTFTMFAHCDNNQAAAASRAVTPVPILRHVMDRLWTEPPADQQRDAETLLDLAERLGTPLVDRNALVFVFQGVDDKVLVSGAFTPPLPLRQVPGTSVMVGRAEIRDMDRATVGYALNVNGRVMRDPLNQGPVDASCPEQTAWHGRAALRVRWHDRVSVQSPRGKVERIKVPSTNLKATRDVNIYLPPGYRPDRRYPLVLVADAQLYINCVHLPEMLDQLITGGSMEPVVMAMVTTHPDYRVRSNEYLPDGNHWAQFQGFLLEELLPDVERKYSAGGDRQHRAMLGFSNGAALSIFTTASHPDLFRGAISESVAYVEGKRGMPFPPELAPQYYLIMGKLETMLWENSQLLQADLRHRGATLQVSERTGGHEPIFWAEELGPALQWFFPPR